ncbi:MAG: TrkH family potassium uptake protein [Chitinivibrionales bacterium]
MNLKFVFYSIGKLLQVLAAVLLIPSLIALAEVGEWSFPQIFMDAGLSGFLIAIILSALTGTMLSFIPQQKMQGNAVREGFGIVTFGWIIIAFFGAIPMFVYFLGHLDNVTVYSISHAFTNAYFESMSGFTTTGATILTDIEVLPKGILFWRSLTHWLGGMGIVTLVLAILPAFGFTAYQMFRGEVPGPNTERLKPRLAQTAKILWGVYALLTIIETILLVFGGMSFFEALCHSFGTMATGGFSTRNASIAAFNSDYIDWVITVFMFLAGVNFIIHYRVIFSADLYMVKTDREFRFYLGVILLAIIIGTLALQFQGIAPVEEIQRSYRHAPLSGQDIDFKVTTEKLKTNNIYQTIRYVSFQVISITTTTGYGTADFDVWPNFIRFMLVVLMFFGGCAGSTGGGMKMIRIMVLLKTIEREIKTIIQPRLIAPVKIVGTALEEKQIANIVGFITLFIVLFVGFSGIMSLMIGDMTTAVTSVVATMCNIGPGLSGVGISENYNWIPIAGKWVLTICMLLGRLEVYTVIIAFSPLWWKK